MHEMYIGKEAKVLWEEKEKGYWKGHTTNYMIVKMMSNEEKENKIEKVKITKNEGEFLIAKKEN